MKIKNKYIPLAEPVLDGNEKKYLSHCINDGWISTAGKFVDNIPDLELSNNIVADVENFFEA